MQPPGSPGQAGNVQLQLGFAAGALFGHCNPDTEGGTPANVNFQHRVFIANKKRTFLPN